MKCRRLLKKIREEDYLAEKVFCGGGGEVGRRDLGKKSKQSCSSLRDASKHIHADLKGSRSKFDLRPGLREVT